MFFFCFYVESIVKIEFTKPSQSSVLHESPHKHRATLLIQELAAVFVGTSMMEVSFFSRIMGWNNGAARSAMMATGTFSSSIRVHLRIGAIP